MKVIENKDCRIITTTQQGLVLVEDSGVIIQIDQQVILKAAENLGLLNYNIVREPDEVEKLATQLESALATCKQADETIKQLKSSLADRQAIVSKHLRKIEEQEKLLKEKDITIRNLTKDVKDGDRLIEELTFQRDAAKDSVSQLKRQLEEQIAKTNTVTLNRDSYKTYIDKLEDNVKSLEDCIEEKKDIIKNLSKELEERSKYKDMLDKANNVIKENDETISKLSKEIKNYEETGAYILRYTITDGNIIMDNARVHEPIICADSKTAETALRNLRNGTNYAAVFKCCDTSRYNIGFNSESYVISCLDSHDSIEINNRPVAYNLYNLLRLGSITMDNIRDLIANKK